MDKTDKIITYFISCALGVSVLAICIDVWSKTRKENAIIAQFERADPARQVELIYQGAMRLTCAHPILGTPERMIPRNIEEMAALRKSGKCYVTLGLIG